VLVRGGGVLGGRGGEVDAEQEGVQVVSHAGGWRAAPQLLARVDQERLP
jgi:hypothetical protein